MLFDDGKALMAERRFAEACPKFAASQKIDPAPGTLVWLADCYEQNGQTASAWSTYREALTAAKAARQPTREALAAERIAALQKVLSRISLEVKDPSIAGLSVSVDGVPVTQPLWGTPTPFDPGPHTIEATAPGYATFTRKLDLGRAAQETVVVPPLERAAPAPVASASAAPSAAPPRPPPPVVSEPPPAPPPTRSSAMRPAGVALGATGALALVAGVVVQLSARSLAQSAIDDCRAHVRCTAADLSKHDSASSRQTVAWVVGGAGAAMLVAGGVLLWQAPAERGRVWVAPLVAQRGAGAAVGSAW